MSNDPMRFGERPDPSIADENTLPEERGPDAMYADLARRLKSGDDDARAEVENMPPDERRQVTESFQRLYGEPFTL